MREVKDRFWWRQKMMRYADEQGVSEAAVEFGSIRRTLRLWLSRYLKKGVKGLLDGSRAPKRIPHKTFPALEQKVVELKRHYSTFSAMGLTSSRGLSPRGGVV